MGKVFKRLPSPSMAVAFIALLAALGGTAVALPGGNSVKKDDIAAGAVNSSDIRNNSVLGRDVRTSTLRGSDIGPNSVTGSDVDEGSLGTVPSANTANSANTATSANTANQASNAGTVDNISIATIDYRAPSGAATSTIFERGGLRLVANCVGGDLDVTALSLTNDSAISLGAVNFATVTDSNTDTGPANTPIYSENDDFDLLDSFQVLGATTDDGTQGNLVFTTPASSIVTITYRGEEDVNGLGSANDCFFTGRATISG